MSVRETPRFERFAAMALALAAVFWPDSMALSATKKSEEVRPAYVNFGPHPLMVHPVRVGIATKASVARIAVWSPGWVFVDNKPVMPLKPQVVYSITPGRITELATGRSVSLPTDARTQIASRDAMGT
ncbi:MAG: hypothetical protein IAF58_10250, partial [Leptolyngbya sp.]|nr:hypothetical protein [Candidatus Melainabacteria bacterium]